MWYNISNMHKNTLPKLLFLLLLSSLTINLFFNTATVNAGSCGGVETAIINCNESENGIGHILKLVLEIMSIGAGILATIGIGIFGLQYLKAGGNEEQTRKAKRRLIEIVIGLVLFVLMGALVNWLIPSGTTNPDDIPAFNPSGSSSSGSGGSSSSGGSGSNPSGSGSGSGYNPSGSGSGSGGGSSNPTGSSIATRINQTAHKFSWPAGDEHNYFSYTPAERQIDVYKQLFKTPNPDYFDALSKYTVVGYNHISQSDFENTSDDWGFWRQGASCDVFVGMVVRDVTGNMDFPFRSPGQQQQYCRDHPEMFTEIQNPSVNNLQPGDLMFVYTSNRQHAQIYCGTTDYGAPIICQASFRGYTAAVTEGGTIAGFSAFRYTGDK